jgi:hypothetical protein
MNRSSFRKVLDCASPLALWATLAPAKAVEDHRPSRFGGFNARCFLENPLPV